MALMPSPTGAELLIGAANAPLVALGEKNKLLRNTQARAVYTAAEIGLAVIFSLFY